MILKNCHYIITQNNKRDVLCGYDLKIAGQHIAEIGKNLSKERGETVIDCSKKIVMPGLINTHTHLGMHSLKGFCDDRSLFEWLDIVINEEKSLSEKDILRNTKQGAVECIKYGTTTVYDSYKYATERADVFEELGMRAFLSSTVRKEKHMKHVKSLLEKCNSLKSRLINPVVAAHSLYMCTDEALGMIIDASRKNSLIRRIHVAESKDEISAVKKEKKLRPVEYLNKIGFLGKKALLVHCVYVEDNEISMIAKSSSKISHNPISNMKLAAGAVTPVVKMLKKGIRVGLGTDSVVSNNNLDMFEEMKFAALLHKHENKDAKALTYQQALDMATISAAKCLGMNDVGFIGKGAKADIITLDFHGLLPANNIVSNIVYCAHGDNVCESIINGKIVLKNKKLITK